MERPDRNDYILYSFSADFDSRQTILRKEKHPLGFYATQVLLIPDETISELQRKISVFQERFSIFQSARTTSAIAAAHAALQDCWADIRKLPGFQEQLSGMIWSEENNRILNYANDSVAMDRLVTEGTPERQEMKRWIAALSRLPEDLRLFKRNTDWMLRRYFLHLSDRSTESYAKALLRFQVELDNIWQSAQTDLYDNGNPYDPPDFSFLPVDPRTVQFGADVSVAVTPYLKPTGNGFVERMTFSSWVDFIYMDLYRGMAAGNLPRICENCGRYFLSRGAYRTIYCEQIAPGEEKKTCREVGAHAKERQKIDTDYARKEYQRAYNRLKMRRYRHKISEDDYLREVERIDDLKDRMAHCEIHSEEFEKLVRMLNPAKKKKK